MTAPCDVDLGDGLVAAAEGALWIPATRTAVLADLHVGYEAFHAARGQAVPRVEAAELAARLARVVARLGAERVVVAGDVKHAFSRPVAGERADLARVLAGASGAEVVLVRGNHDVGLERATELAVHDVFDAAPGVRVAHGHAPVLRDAWLVVGHEHPIVHLATGVGSGLVAPAFLVDAARRTVVLPALSPWAAGVAPRRRYAGAALAGADPRDARVVAVAEGDAWDFGPLRDLHRN